ncbi:hypothetical protein MMC08_002777 [Hypocenomyce scalaris]|nr:hypothetical protein [Hypocenomyce scalaris]
MLIVGRAVAGMGTSGIMNGATIIIAQCVPMEKRPFLIGIVMGGFWINLPIGGLVAVMLIFIRIPEQIPKPPPLSVLRSLPSKLDLIGFAIFSPAAIQLLLALQYGGVTFAWNSAQIIGLFCGAGATFVLFLGWDYYNGDGALIPLSMARKTIVWASCLVYGLLMGQLFCASYYLPVYFQGIKGASPTLSGVYLLPSVLSHIFAAVSSGVLLQRVGYYVPLSLTSAVIGAVASGLVSTFSPGTSTGQWVGYQILLGAGRGFGLQMPIIAVQNAVAPAQIPLAMSLVIFSQSFAGALFLSFSDTIFTNSLKTLIPIYAPSVSAQTIIDAGATGFQNEVSGANLAGVLIAYAKSIDRVFYLTAGMGVGCFVFAWGMGWKDIRKKDDGLKA